MMVRVGDFSSYQGNKTVYVSEENYDSGSNHPEKMILTSKDLDRRWIKRICEKAEAGKGREYHCDPVNRKFILLYLIFSTRNRVYFKDWINISNDHIKSNFAQLEIFTYEQLFVCFMDFMREKHYQLKRLNGNILLYSGKAGIGIENYSLKENLSNAGRRYILKAMVRFLERKIIVFLTDISKSISIPFVQIKVKSRFKNMKKMHSKSESGCLFYKAAEKNKSFFLKCSAIISSNRDEYVAAKRILKKSHCKEFYLLPLLEKSDAKILVYPWMEQHQTLGDVLKIRNLTDTEYDLLLDFFIKVLKDLKHCGIVHRDFHLENIIVETAYGEKIMGYKLIDFGCACTDRKISNHGFIEKRKNRYVGSRFRYDIDSWNDAGSALYLMLQIHSSNKSKKDKLKYLAQMIEEEETISI